MVRGRVSCVMVTQAGRLELARVAVGCFTAQTYEDRELVIVTDDDCQVAVPWVPIDYTDRLRADGFQPDAHPRIASASPVHVVRAPRGLTLGDLRNMGTAAARGEYIAQWDDDDWSHRDRLALQVRELERTGAPAVVCGTILLAWPARDLFKISRTRRWECTMLARRWRLPAYPSLDRGEDTPLIEGIDPRMLPYDPWLYIKRVHHANKWDDAHHAHSFETAPHSCTQVERAMILQRLDGRSFG